jgi:PKD repeat protein
MIKQAGMSGIRRFFEFVAVISTFLLLSGAASAVQLAWDPSPDPTVVGYVVHTGSSSGVYTTEVNVGPATAYTLPTLAAGTYYFAVTAYDASAAESMYSNEVSYTAGAPVASFSASATSGVAPLAINFTSTSTGSITSYLWTFGDGTSSASQNPAKVYASAGTYTVALQVTGPNGSNTQTRTNYVTVTAGGDTTPPGIPPNPSALAISSTSIRVSWSPATDNVGVTAYLLERCQGAGCSNFAQIATLTGTSYTDSALSTGTTYQYRVRAMDAAGNRGGYSAIVGASTAAAADTTPPTAPGTPVAAASGTTAINLRWPAATDNVGVVGYRLERCTGAACTAFVAIAAPAGTTYGDTGLSASTTYRYRVRAIDAATNLGPYSPIVTVATPSSSAIVFVQLNRATPQGSAPTVQVPFPSAQGAGNLNVVVVGWEDTSTVASVTDSAGNVYTRAVGPHTFGTSLSQSIYYAKNIKAAGAGNTVTVKFSGSGMYPDVRVVEYRGADPVNPLDVTAGASGTGTLAATPSVTTTAANALLFAATTVWTHVTGPGSGFTQRVITYNGNIVEDRAVSAMGGYNATAPMTNGNWVMQMVAFRAAP